MARCEPPSIEDVGESLLKISLGGVGCRRSPLLRPRWPERFCCRTDSPVRLGIVAVGGIAEVVIAPPVRPF
jgi:hypothetical protein